jgi:hypothetical protein
VNCRRGQPGLRRAELVRCTRTRPLDRGDVLRIAKLAAGYHDLPLGTVDASVLAAAERLGASEVGTLDRRHFTVVRPSRIEAFDLLPARR